MNTSSVCPEVTFTCSAVDLSSPILRWFLNDNQFVLYAISPSDEYPLPLEPPNATLNALVGGVNVQILNASFNEDNPDAIASIQSTMTVNISALQGAGVTNVSCGLFNTMTRAYKNVTFNSIGGKFFLLVYLANCNEISSSSVPPTPVNISVRSVYSSDLYLSDISVQWNQVVNIKEY